jgi:hypothetical protein
MDNEVILFWNVASGVLAVHHHSWLKIGFFDLRMKKEELCSGKSEGKRRCDLSAIP